MKNDNFATNLLLAGVLFFLMVCTYSFFSYFDQREEQEIILQELTEQQAKQDIKLREYEAFEKILKDLDRIPKEYQAEVIAICWDESRLDYNVTHKDKDTVGICGIKKTIFKQLLDKEGIDINSLEAGYFVYELFDYDIAWYKGAIHNKNTVERTKDYIEIVKGTK